MYVCTGLVTDSFLFQYHSRAGFQRPTHLFRPLIPGGKSVQTRDRQMPGIASARIGVLTRQHCPMLWDHAQGEPIFASVTHVNSTATLYGVAVSC